MGVLVPPRFVCDDLSLNASELEEGALAMRLPLSSSELSSFLSSSTGLAVLDARVGAVGRRGIVHNNPVVALLMLAHLPGSDPTTALSKLADRAIDESTSRRAPRRKPIQSEVSAIFQARAKAIKSMMKSLQKSNKKSAGSLKKPALVAAMSTRHRNRASVSFSSANVNVDTDTNGDADANVDMNTIQSTAPTENEYHRRTPTVFEEIHEFSVLTHIRFWKANQARKAAQRAARQYRRMQEDKRFLTTLCNKAKLRIPLLRRRVTLEDADGDKDGGL